MRESAQSWRDLLLDLKRRGLSTGPQLAVADGALGFWKALGEIWPSTREQRCWVHKTANVLNKLPKSLHGKTKRALQDIWMAETKNDAVAALDAFAESYAPEIRQGGLFAPADAANSMLCREIPYGRQIPFPNRERTGNFAESGQPLRFRRPIDE